MKRTCLLTNSNTDEQNTCEFHPAEISIKDRLFDPKNTQRVKNSVRMKRRSLIIIILSILIGFGAGFQSCTKEELKDQNKYFDSVQYVSNKSADQLKIVYNILSVTQYLPAGELVAHIKSGIQVYKIVYKTDYKGEQVMASGLVCLPDQAGDYPILCFQNGTNTLYSKAPTRNSADNLFTILEGVASMGFIVVIPDYLGFGESEQVFHPYLHAESTVQSLVDIIRATKEFAVDQETIAKPTNDLFILGYSQGGWATLSLQKAIEQKYASEFNLVASACGAGSYKLAAVNDYALSQTSYPMPYFLAYVFKSYKSTGILTTPYQDVFNTVYAAKIDQLFDGLHSGDQINAELTTNINQLFTPAYLTGHKTSSSFAAIRTAFESNSVTAWNVATPTRLFHATGDVYIPISVSEQMLAEFRSAGVPESKMKMISIPGYDHPGGIVPTGVSAVLWFLDLK